MMLLLEKIPLNSNFKTPRKTKAFEPAKRLYTTQALGNQTQELGNQTQELGHQTQELGHQVQVCMVALIMVSLCMEMFISHRVLTQKIFQFT